MDFDPTEQRQTEDSQESLATASKPPEPPAPAVIEYRVLGFDSAMEVVSIHEGSPEKTALKSALEQFKVVWVSGYLEGAAPGIEESGNWSYCFPVVDSRLSGSLGDRLAALTSHLSNLRDSSPKPEKFLVFAAVCGNAIVGNAFLYYNVHCDDLPAEEVLPGSTLTMSAAPAAEVEVEVAATASKGWGCSVM